MVDQPKHGIVALSHSFQILHLCGLDHPPTQADYDILQAELDAEPAFGLVGRRSDYILVSPPPAHLAVLTNDGIAWTHCEEHYHRGEKLEKVPRDEGLCRCGEATDQTRPL